jgi:hypothetical protein
MFRILEDRLTELVIPSLRCACVLCERLSCGGLVANATAFVFVWDERI